MVYADFSFDVIFVLYYLPPAAEGHGREIIKRLP